MRPLTNTHRTFFAAAIAVLLFFTPLAAQKKKGKVEDNTKRAVMWESVDISARDLYLGPGGADNQPDTSKLEFIKEEKGGYSKKFRVKDARGETWVVKVSDEAQSETAAVRLLWAIGYKTETNYLVESVNIPGKGKFKNARFEARPDDVERGKQWQWGNNPFQRTREYQGLKVMMAFINNWDMKSANNVVLKTIDERQYVISDLGVSFGKTGSNSLPLFWRIGRSRNKPEDYAKSKFIDGITSRRVKFVFNGKNRSRMRDITFADARWLADLLMQLSDKQIQDAFRAANYSEKNIDLLTSTVKKRIAELDQAAMGKRIMAVK